MSHIKRQTTKNVVYDVLYKIAKASQCCLQVLSVRMGVYTSHDILDILQAFIAAKKQSVELASSCGRYVTHTLSKTMQQRFFISIHVYVRRSDDESITISK